MRSFTLAVIALAAGLRPIAAHDTTSSGSASVPPPSSPSSKYTTPTPPASTSKYDTTKPTTSSQTSFKPSTSLTTTWSDWTSCGECVPTTIYDTIIETRVETSIQTVPGPNITETEVSLSTVTEISTTTEVAISTTTIQVTASPVTETSLTSVTILAPPLPPSTETRVETSSVTVISTLTIFETVLSTATMEETTTINVPPITITSITSFTQTVSETISTCPIPTSGIVTCPSRIINPTYTTSSPLPSSYLWGCPPGKLCKPKKENCNFEQNTPADSYYCAPDECQPVAQLPPLETWLDFENVNDTCAWLTPIDDYFNINPTFLDLDFDIFNIFGQALCSPTQPANTVTIPAPTTVLVPTTLTASLTEIVPTTLTVTLSEWQQWSAASSSAPPHVTKRAELSERGLEKKAIAVASQCYAVCDYAAAVYQSVGKVPELCAADGQWSSAFDRVTSCTSKYSATAVTSVASVLNDPILYCRANAKRSLFGRKAAA